MSHIPLAIAALFDLILIFNTMPENGLSPNLRSQFLTPAVSNPRCPASFHALTERPVWPSSGRPQYRDEFIDVTHRGKNNQYWTARRCCSHYVKRNIVFLKNIRYLQSCTLYLIYREFWFLSLFFFFTTQDQRKTGGKGCFHRKGTCWGRPVGRVSWLNAIVQSNRETSVSASRSSVRAICQLPASFTGNEVENSSKHVNLHRQLPTAP